MKKLIFVSFMLFGLIYAQEGKDIYKKYCASCHILKPPMGFMKNKKMQHFDNIKAPPMAAVSKRVKMFYPKKEDFVRFVVDYIQNPSKEKGVCMPMAYKRFGTMPPIGKSLSDKEKEKVANFIYTLNFTCQACKMRK
ncbi:c-type cytochrome [Nitrosophilus kaiyonis]|uniref:c-type cytochrome n=1 Tax=Nitrosophilus kaiyonis TaxID=2930200 RepID=UPI002490F056|nr:cytochrome c [Nitrosophilus kaiyonis]